MAYRSLSTTVKHLKQGCLLSTRTRTLLSRGCLSQLQVPHEFHTHSTLAGLMKSDHILRNFNFFRCQHRFLTDKSNNPESSTPSPEGENSKKPQQVDIIRMNFECKIDFPELIKVISRSTDYKGGDKGGDTNSGCGTPFKQMIGFAVLVVAAAAVLDSLYIYFTRYKEITMKEFFHKYLSSGMVKKVDIINNKWVKVKFVPGAKVDSFRTYWFSLDNVVEFERNLEKEQLEMNIEPSNFITVVYKKRDWTKCIARFILLILVNDMIALVIMSWFGRKFVRMMKMQPFKMELWVGRSQEKKVGKS